MAILRRFQVLFALLGILPLIAITAQYWPTPQSRGAPTEMPQALAQSNPNSPWNRACEGGSAGGEVCYIQQDFATDQGTLLIAAFGFTEERLPVGVLTFPLNVTLPAGLALKVDEREQTSFEFTSCNPVGCRAIIPLSHDLIAAFKVGNTLHVGWRTADNEQIVVPFSLAGFTAGWNSLAR